MTDEAYRMYELYMIICLKKCLVKICKHFKMFLFRGKKAEQIYECSVPKKQKQKYSRPEESSLSLVAKA